VKIYVKEYLGSAMVLRSYLFVNTLGRIVHQYIYAKRLSTKTEQNRGVSKGGISGELYLTMLWTKRVVSLLSD
jgi:hypothetical protein